MRLRMYAYVNVYSFTQAIRSRVECLCWLETTLFDIKYIYKHLTLRIINESSEKKNKQIFKQQPNKVDVKTEDSLRGTPTRYPTGTER